MISYPGTYDSAKDDLYIITDRSKNKFILSPVGKYSTLKYSVRFMEPITGNIQSFQTHEEAFAELLAHELLSYRNFPLLLYQITSKFRDEVRPKLGFLRSKEFIMKDLYSFDIDQEHTQKTYDKVTSAYKKIFDFLKIPYHISKLYENRIMEKFSTTDLSFPQMRLYPNPI